MESLLNRMIEPPRAAPAVLPSVRIRSVPADFEVCEIPTYLPDGKGEHLFLWIEKEDVAAVDLISRLSRRLDVPARDIGVAGQKDRRAVTQQFVSVPRVCRDRLAAVSGDGISLLSVSAHGNKLRTGHLRGNRFRIVLRPPDDTLFTAEDADAIRSRLSAIAVGGFPNYFGPQRFGHSGNTVRDGIALVSGKGPQPRWKPNRRRTMKKLVASAVQSAVFNLVLAERVTDGTFATPRAGDVVCARTGIRPFLFDERGNTPESELIPMGPLPGPAMPAAAGEIRDRESAVLNQLGLSAEDFSRFAKLTPGVRRRMVEYPSHTSAALCSDGSIQTSFDLPAGCYATVLLAELCGSLH